MSISFSAQRALAVRSPAIPLVAGRPALVPLKLEGTEGVNSLFHYTLTLQTPDASPGTATGSNFDLDRFIGVEITCSIELEGMGSFQPGLPGDRSVTHQGAGIHDLLGGQPHRTACLDRGAQHVSRRYLWNAVLVADVGRLCAFACPRRAQQNESHGIP